MFYTEPQFIIIKSPRILDNGYDGTTGRIFISVGFPLRGGTEQNDVYVSVQ